MPKRIRFIPARSLLPVLLALLLCGCSATQFAYNRLDWYIGWQIGRYASLDRGQEQVLDQSVDAVWRWHRRQALPVYAEDLREIAGAARQSASVEQVEDWALRAATHWRELARQMHPHACTLLASLDEAQVASVLVRVDREIEDDVREFLDPPEEKRREQARKRLRARLKHWLGRLDESQEERVRDFSRTRPLRYEEWIDTRRQWRARLATALDQRAAAGFCQQLMPLLVPEELDRAALIAEDSVLRTWSRFLAQFSATLDESQRQHLRERLGDLATDLGALAVQPPA